MREGFVRFSTFFHRAISGKGHNQKTGSLKTKVSYFSCENKKKNSKLD